MISRFGIAYKRDCSQDISREMLVALIQRDNLDGLGKGIELLKDEHALTLDRISMAAFADAFVRQRL